VDQLQSPKDKFEVHPTISGKAGGRSLNLHQFARDGVELLGRVRGVQGGALLLAPNLEQHLAEADQFEARATQAIDRYIIEKRIDAPMEPLPTLTDGFGEPPTLRLNLEANCISTVIWASGYSFDFSLIHLPVCDPDGYPIQTRGISEFPGLYFLGLPWLHSRKSGILYGVGEDAEYVVSNIVQSSRPQKLRLAS
jgi:putative flavoprotein involved in K+ transport